ncbi:MAG: exodeoxyribonuclease VII small subunit [Myxococcota bacterium]|jgi:exodeoxyribonuclease VII small subunit
MTQPGGDSRSFEQALTELEGCVRHLDSGELPLENSLQMFESGIALVRECQELLDAAERRVVELTRAPDAPQGTREHALDRDGR